MTKHPLQRSVYAVPPTKAPGTNQWDTLMWLPSQQSDSLIRAKQVIVQPAARPAAAAAITPKTNGEFTVDPTTVPEAYKTSVYSPENEMAKAGVHPTMLQNFMQHSRVVPTLVGNGYLSRGFPLNDPRVRGDGATGKRGADGLPVLDKAPPNFFHSHH